MIHCATSQAASLCVIGPATTVARFGTCSTLTGLIMAALRTFMAFWVGVALSTRAPWGDYALLSNSLLSELCFRDVVLDLIFAAFWALILLFDLKTSDQMLMHLWLELFFMMLLDWTPWDQTFCQSLRNKPVVQFISNSWLKLITQRLLCYKPCGNLV